MHTAWICLQKPYVPWGILVQSQRNMCLHAAQARQIISQQVWSATRVTDDSRPSTWTAHEFADTDDTSNELDLLSMWALTICLKRKLLDWNPTESTSSNFRDTNVCKWTTTLSRRVYILPARPNLAFICLLNASHIPLAGIERGALPRSVDEVRIPNNQY